MQHAEADRTQLEHACAELLKSEETYLEILECIVGIFQKPLRAWAEEEASQNAAKTGGVTVAEVDALFGSATTLRDIHVELVEKLRLGAGDPASLAATMATWAAGPLRLNAAHVSCFAVSLEVLNKLLEKRARFRAAVRVLELQPAARNQRLQALLVNTVQRLPRYSLTLREILKNVPQEEGGAFSAGEASELLTAARGDAATLIAAGMSTSTMLHLALSKIHGVTSRVDSSVGDTEARHRPCESAARCSSATT